MVTSDLLTPPRLEGAVEVARDRYLGFAEFGCRHGRPAIWMHGTPGARRQVPEVARVTAAELDLRIIGIDRPGVGGSTPHRYSSMLESSVDFERVLDELGVDEFVMVGLSGGGPYVLACAHAMPDRCKAAGILGGVAPTVGPDAADGGVVDLARRYSTVLNRVHTPLAFAVMTGAYLLRPVAGHTLRLYAITSPPGDREVFAKPEMRAMFVDDLLIAGKRGIRAPAYDVLLFGRDWGFSVRDVDVPVHWWHGDADHIVPLRHGEHVVSLLPDAEFHLRTEESHLGTLGIADEILGTLMNTWEEREHSSLATR
jgi:pimeloyl-ACP methyl ester carboxylesterase